MKRQPFKLLYDLHAWIGLACGLIFYVISLAGVCALFDRELSPWQRGDTAPPAALAPQVLDRAVARALNAAPDAAVRNLQITLPTGYHPVLSIRLGDPRQTIHIAPDNGQPITTNENDAAGVLTRLHTDMLLPQPLGRYLVGLIGLLMLVSVLSGLFLHRKFIREFFTFRLGRSRRLMLADLHKSIGLWGLPFHAVMALTGTLLGFVGLLLPLATFISFKGDTQAATEALMGGPMPPALSIPADTIPLSQALAIARTEFPVLSPRIVSVRGHDTAGARIEIIGDVSGTLIYYPWVTLDGASGQVLSVTDWSRETLGRRVYGMIAPLHYGSFGGIAVKVLYVLFGAGNCILILSGLWVWRSRLPAPPNRLARAWDRSTAAVCCGLPMAIVVLFIAARLIPGQTGIAQSHLIAILLASWGAAALWAGWRPTHRGGRELLIATGACLIAIPLISWLTTGVHLINAYTAGGTASAVADLVALTLGVGLIFGAIPFRNQNRPPLINRK